MKRSTFLLLVFFAVFGLLGQLETARAAITWWGDIDPANPTTWDSSTSSYIGRIADGGLTVDDNSDLLSGYAYIGYNPDVTGQVTVTGTGSTWTNSGYLYVGHYGVGTLAITDGGAVSSSSGYISATSDSTGEVTVSGVGSTWNNSEKLYVGYSGSGTLTITDGGLVNTGGVLTIDRVENGNSFIIMATGGMLALFGNADDSLADFLDLIDGTDAIRYWEESISEWAHITGATPDTDYTLAYVDEVGSDLYGYTLLTVTTSEPIPGDANGDSKVNDEDAAALAAHWGQSGGWAQGDFNDDGLVGPADASILAANWGYGTEQSHESNAVPEPGVLLTLLIGASILLVRRGR